MPRQRSVKKGREPARSLDRCLRVLYPHRFQHFCHTWLDRGGPEGDLMELYG